MRPPNRFSSADASVSASKNARSRHPPPESSDSTIPVEPCSHSSAESRSFSSSSDSTISENICYCIPCLKLHGIFIDTTTPFDHAGELYRVKIEHNIDKWNQTSVAGYVIGGFAGEGSLLAADEKAELWKV